MVSLDQRQPRALISIFVESRARFSATAWGNLPVLARYFGKSIVKQDHRTIKRRTRPMLGFKTLRCARNLLGGIEVTHMIEKGQMKETKEIAAEHFTC
jgi:transposase-like protein